MKLLLMNQHRECVLKTLLNCILAVVVLMSCSSEKGGEEVAEPVPWIPFEWVGDTISGRFFDKLAINLPFSIEGIPHQFSSQFDLGATSTMVYGNAFVPYLEAFSEVAAALDTANKDYQIQGQSVGALKGVTFSLGDVVFSDQELLYFDGFGDTLTVDSIASASVKHIGTVGPDLFQNKVLLIDFPNQRIASVDSLPTDYRDNATLVDMKLDHGRIKLRVRSMIPCSTPVLACFHSWSPPKTGTGWGTYPPRLIRSGYPAGGSTTTYTEHPSTYRLRWETIVCPKEACTPTRKTSSSSFFRRRVSWE